jgi:hypothetical protein
VTELEAVETKLSFPQQEEIERDVAAGVLERFIS